MMKQVLALLAALAPAAALAQPVRMSQEVGAGLVYVPGAAGAQGHITVQFGTAAGTVADGGALASEITRALAAEAVVSSGVATEAARAQAAEASAAQKAANLSDLASPAAARLNLRVAPVTPQARAPSNADDTTGLLLNGSTWQSPGGLWQAQDVSAGAAAWARADTVALPLDVIGLYVGTVAVQAGGTGYAAGDTITFSGGVQATVTAVSSGAVTAASLSQQTMHACSFANPMPVLATSGSGSAATFNFGGVLRPTAYGVRQLTKCYAGNAMTVARSDTGEAKAIPFRADGALDLAAVGQLAAGPQPMGTYPLYNTGATPRVTVWNDQGGGGNNATAALATAPTIYAGRMHGNSVPVMFDALGQANPSSPVASFMTIPSAVSVNGQALTMAVLAGTVTGDFKNASWINMGCITGGCFVFGMDNGVFGTLPEAGDGNTNPSISSQPPDGPTLYLDIGTPSATTFSMGDLTKISAGAPVGNTVSGGFLGAAGAGQNTSGLVDESVVIVVPWALSPGIAASLKASIYQTFGVASQHKGLIVTLGDSHVDSWGTPFHQSWPRAMMTMLNRPDVQLINEGSAGALLSDIVTNRWATKIAPELAAYSGGKFVLIQGCYNDLGGGQTPAQCEASFQTAVGLAHASSAKAVCVTDVIRNGPAALNANMQAVAAFERTAASGCDAVIDFESIGVFNAAAGPWSAPWFNPDGVHLGPGGVGLEAALAASVMAPLLP